MTARGYAALGLHQPKNRLNVGEIMRAAGCYGVSMVAVCGRRFERSKTDTQDAWKHLPTINVADLMDAVPFGAVPVAVEFIDTATPLPQFTHPERAYYLLGPEDGSLPTELVKRCRHVVYVPSRHCMNLAATANVLLYDRMVKRQAIEAAYSAKRVPAQHALEILAAQHSSAITSVANRCFLANSVPGGKV